jgi:hypothetical protein
MTEDCNRPDGRTECLTVNTWALADIVLVSRLPLLPPQPPHEASLTDTIACLLARPDVTLYTVLLSYYVTLCPHCSTECQLCLLQRSIARSFLLKQRHTFRFRLFVYSKERLREQNTKMAGCDVWEWRFESQPLGGFFVAVRVSMFVINGHERRGSLLVETACFVPKIM